MFKKAVIFSLGMLLWLPMVVGLAVKYWLHIGNGANGGFSWGLWYALYLYMLPYRTTYISSTSSPPAPTRPSITLIA